MYKKKNKIIYKKNPLCYNKIDKKDGYLYESRRV